MRRVMTGDEACFGAPPQLAGVGVFAGLGQLARGLLATKRRRRTDSRRQPLVANSYS